MNKKINDDELYNYIIEKEREKVKNVSKERNEDKKEIDFESLFDPKQK